MGAAALQETLRDAELGLVRTTPLRRPPPLLGADARTQAAVATHSGRLRLRLLISAKLGHHAGSPGPRLPPPAPSPI